MLEEVREALPGSLAQAAGADRRPGAAGRAGPPGGRADHRVRARRARLPDLRHGGRPPLPGRGRPHPRRGPQGGRGDPRRGRRLRRLQARQLRGRPHQDHRLGRPRPREAARHAAPASTSRDTRTRTPPSAATTPRPCASAPTTTSTPSSAPSRPSSPRPWRPSAAAARSCTAGSPPTTSARTWRPRTTTARPGSTPATPTTWPTSPTRPARAAAQQPRARRSRPSSQLRPQQAPVRLRSSPADPYSGYQQRVRPAAGPVRLPAAAADPYAATSSSRRYGSAGRRTTRRPRSSRTTASQQASSPQQQQPHALDETSLFDTSMIELEQLRALRTGPLTGSERPARRTGLGRGRNGPVSWLFGRVYVRDHRCPEARAAGRSEPHRSKAGMALNARLDHRNPLVFDTHELGRRPGALQRLTRSDRRSQGSRDRGSHRSAGRRAGGARTPPGVGHGRCARHRHRPCTAKGECVRCLEPLEQRARSGLPGDVLVP